jgi:hypothetical protein
MTVEKTKPFDYAQDVTKQVLTLSTGVVTITIAFMKDISKNAPEDARIALFSAWGLFALSIAAGICTLLNLTGRVGKADDAASTGINAGAVRLFSIAQLACFALAIAGTVYFGARAFDARASPCSTLPSTQTTSQLSQAANGC